MTKRIHYSQHETEHLRTGYISNDDTQYQARRLALDRLGKLSFTSRSQITIYGYINYNLIRISAYIRYGAV